VLPYKKFDKGRHPRTCCPKIRVAFHDEPAILDPLVSESNQDMRSTRVRDLVMILCFAGSTTVGYRTSEHSSLLHKGVGNSFGCETQS
jgi:hypothetical protein